LIDRLTERSALTGWVHGRTLRVQRAIPAEPAAIFDVVSSTVEHVLPQRPAPDSAWRDWFTDDEREHGVDRLANLVLLTRRKNSEASNYEFGMKKQKYFVTKSGVSPFALTTQVLGADSWTPQALEERQEELAETLVTLWRRND
jgi:Protein of unknown function (DUF1524)